MKSQTSSKAGTTLSPSIADGQQKKIVRIFIIRTIEIVDEGRT